MDVKLLRAFLWILALLVGSVGSLVIRIHWDSDWVVLATSLLFISGALIGILVWTMEHSDA